MLTLEGRDVDRQRVAVDDFAAILSEFQLAVRRKAEELAGRKAKPGRLPSEIADPARLDLVGLQFGSLVAELELAQLEQPPLIDTAEGALEAVVEHVAALEAGEGVPEIAPAVAEHLAEIARRLSEGGGIQRLVVRAVKSGKTATMSGAIMERIEAARKPPSGPRRGKVAGRLLEVDYKDHTAEVYTATGMVKLQYPESMDETMRIAGKKLVTVEGLLEEPELGRGARLAAETVQIAEEHEDYWRKPSLEELAKAQNVGPIKSLANFEGYDFWPEDQSADDFLAGIWSRPAPGND